MKNNSELSDIFSALKTDNSLDAISVLQEIIIKIDKVLKIHSEAIQFLNEKTDEMIKSSNNNAGYFMEIFEKVGVKFVNLHTDTDKEKLN